MTPPLKKLNLTEKRELIVLNAATSFEKELAGVTGVGVRRSVNDGSPIAFAIAFVRTLADVQSAASLILRNAVGDAIVWFAYPKGTSTRFKCEFNRDAGFAAVRPAGSTLCAKW